jgi:hypothetical protein
MRDEVGRRRRKKRKRERCDAPAMEELINSMRDEVERGAKK